MLRLADVLNQQVQPVQYIEIAHIERELHYRIRQRHMAFKLQIQILLQKQTPVSGYALQHESTKLI